MAERCYDVSELEVGENATVHGRILELSPIKTSRNKVTVLISMESYLMV